MSENDSNLEEKIEAEITPDMMKAGFDAYYFFSLDYGEVEDRIKGIYVAMEVIRRKSLSIVVD